MDAHNVTAPLVIEYSQRKLLAKLGYRFNSDDLTTFEVEAFGVIANEFSKQEELELKASNKRKR